MRRIKQSHPEWFKDLANQSFSKKVLRNIKAVLAARDEQHTNIMLVILAKDVLKYPVFVSNLYRKYGSRTRKVRPNDIALAEWSEENHKVLLDFVDNNS